MRLNIGTQEYDGPSSQQVFLNNATLWLSYGRLVAFKVGKNLRVSENCWGKTTGRHINTIDGGDQDARGLRVPREEFEREANEMMVLDQEGVEWRHDDAVDALAHRQTL